MKLRFDYSKALQFVSEREIEGAQHLVKAAAETLMNKSGAGNSFLGWVDLPINYDKEELARIKQSAETIRGNSDALIVIGIGGSYLGARAAIEFVNTPFHNYNKKPQVFFAGNNISASYLNELCDIIKDKDVSINVISKSGTTTEPAIAFRILQKMMVEKYGKEGAAKRIYATTDKEKGALKKLATEEGYETFVVPDDVGGRFSVLTAVGLLPIAVAGIDVDEMLQGAADAHKEYQHDFYHNHCYQYAAVRNVLLNKGKTIEILANYEPALHTVSEWWKQLYGESEGKDGKGIFPASVDFTMDLHSMGQYIQDGMRNIFETVVLVENAGEKLTVPATDVDVDGLGYLEGESLATINKKAAYATLLAHSDGGVPNLIIHLDDTSAYTFGNLVYFFEKACGVSGYMLGINPFDQPGVEAYKVNMFALLGKKGYDKEREILEKRL